MTEALTVDRFRELVDAYGTHIHRWPVAYRQAGLALANEPQAEAILAEAHDLDRVLDAWSVAGPSAALAERIAATAPLKKKSLIRSARLWWSGMGLAAALAGAGVGAAAVMLVMPSATPVGTSTSFGYVVATES